MADITSDDRLFVGVDMATLGSAGFAAVVGLRRLDDGRILVEREAILRESERSSWWSTLEREFGPERARVILGEMTRQMILGWPDRLDFALS